jgi:hypothetical protein
MVKFSVDLDTTSVRRLLLVLKSALNMNLEIKKIEISPSRRGFHIILDGGKDEFDILCKRALLWDEAIRLRYSLKRLALGSKVDICFFRKGGKNSIDVTNHFNLNEIKNDEIDEKIVKKYEEKIKPLMKDCWITCIGLKEELKETISEICSDIKARDKSFDFKIYESYFPKYDYLLVIFSKNRDQAYQRGEWFKRILKAELGIDILYWVKEKKEK